MDTGLGNVLALVDLDYPYLGRFFNSKYITVSYYSLVAYKL